ncbi:sensor histidine kinase [Kibdelosporangium phytohabitans]|uniref:histidine kinase n=1 Tax=Kibdelosporangium phytohabitans TaxID=860235 RepID=A0A0N9I6S9_9PSEU|nr:histidine kinase [Kibdelosporangium phytohabitans]ALG11904.1 histidine kinase [Kibdelosporangium phytohabitans]MBE1463355.1 signal transduction histidine kinase [Kibdelosporangium phytohabitans]
MWHLGEGWLAVAVAACLAAVFFAVRLARARHAYARAVQERGWLLERERQAAADNAVDAERARIARELHDIVSHNVSVMVVQAGAARQVIATQSDDATDALLAVETAGRDTMTELRHMLGLLSPAVDGDDVDRLTPQPSLSRLGALVDRISFAGLPVEVRISGEPGPLPSGVDLTAYRVIQEALTNALKHGGGRKAEVTVRYAEHHLRVEILNSGPSVLSGSTADLPTDAGAGRGLLGLRERVAVLGGDLDARRRLGGGFRVRAKIPLEQL